ncbi:hypothetical protein B0T17DRAFT_511888 [Bombardia bombarda]|uniref:DUF7703 domain-containing protein n=1 Tax=Bombardia bombarda TaxID=252184 RepID=A0AA39WCK2_9PEZI|nr:hypothetical protein B0T17DRAFT_511888 [Bombardia bombarda]
MSDTVENIYDLKQDLQMSMTIAAFTGISWYIGAEINTSLFILFKRRRGLYFWSCALCSWGVVLQPLFIILTDFGVWTNLTGAVILIYLTWLIMVVPQSWLLYSRLHLIVHHDTLLRWIMIVLICTSILFSIPTIVIGTLAQATTINPHLFRINLVWDRVQLTVFFVQETLLSLLYIHHTRKYLRDSALLSTLPYADITYPPSQLDNPTSSHQHNNGSKNARHNSNSRPSETKQVLHHLILTNILVICLDIALLGVQYADLFYLQGAFKPCVYGIKLKVEFAILNRLIDMAKRRGAGGGGSGTDSLGHHNHGNGNGGLGGSGMVARGGGRLGNHSLNKSEQGVAGLDMDGGDIGRSWWWRRVRSCRSGCRTCEVVVGIICMSRGEARSGRRARRARRLCGVAGIGGGDGADVMGVCEKAAHAGKGMLEKACCVRYEKRDGTYDLSGVILLYLMCYEGLGRRSDWLDGWVGYIPKGVQP